MAPCSGFNAGAALGIALPAQGMHREEAQIAGIEAGALAVNGQVGAFSRQHYDSEVDPKTPEIGNGVPYRHQRMDRHDRLDENQGGLHDAAGMHYGNGKGHSQASMWSPDAVSLHSFHDGDDLDDERRYDCLKDP